MFISEIHIQNYRCFYDTYNDFQPGLNVIIGENNAGKTTPLRVLGLIFDRKHRGSIDIYDFYRGISDYSKSPTIRLTVLESRRILYPILAKVLSLLLQN